MFWNQAFVFTYESDEQSQCKNCHKLFGKLNEFTDAIENGDVIQCDRYPEYCIGCCP